MCDADGTPPMTDNRPPRGSLLRLTLDEPRRLHVYAREMIACFDVQMPCVDAQIWHEFAAQSDAMLACPCMPDELAVLRFYWLCAQYEGAQEMVRRIEPAESRWHSDRRFPVFFEYVNALLTRLCRSTWGQHEVLGLAVLFAMQLRLVIEDARGDALAMMRADAVLPCEKLSQPEKKRLWLADALATGLFRAEAQRLAQAEPTDHLPTIHRTVPKRKSAKASAATRKENAGHGAAPATAPARPRHGAPGGLLAQHLLDAQQQQQQQEEAPPDGNAHDDDNDSQHSFSSSDEVELMLDSGVNFARKVAGPAP